jgi:hypothetical protein
MIIPGHACACGETDLFAIKPGIEPEYIEPGPLFPPILVREEVKDEVFCLKCMPRRKMESPDVHD